jgi:hypothetical protein
LGAIGIAVVAKLIPDVPTTLDYARDAVPRIGMQAITPDAATIVPYPAQTLPICGIETNPIIVVPLDHDPDANRACVCFPTAVAISTRGVGWEIVGLDVQERDAHRARTRRALQKPDVAGRRFPIGSGRGTLEDCHLELQPFTAGGFFQVAGELPGALFTTKGSIVAAIDI